LTISGTSLGEKFSKTREKTKEGRIKREKRKGIKNF
jgi:hypothetical protein